jgi:glycogen phosphorylase
MLRSIVGHVQLSLARQAYNLDNLGAYQATAMAVRDDLIVSKHRMPPRTLY